MRLAAFVAAVLATFLALPGGGAAPLIWVALAPLAALLHSATPWRAAAIAYLYGLLGWALAIRGWEHAGTTMLGMSTVAAHLYTLALAAVQAIPFAAMGWLTRRLRRFPYALTFAATGTVALSWMPFMLPGNPAHALFRDPAAMQLLAFGGTPLLLFAVLLVNGLLGSAMVTRSWRPALLGAVLFAAVIVGGHLRLALLPAPEGTSLRIAAIQPAVGIGDDPDWVEIEARQRKRDRLSRMTEAAAAMQPPPDLIVWPEQPVGISLETEDGVRDWIAGLARRVGRPLLVSGKGPIDHVYPNRVEATTSRTWLIGPDGAVHDQHDKVRLVPFGEYLPLDRELPWLRRLISYPRYTLPGRPARPIDLALGVKAIVAICYEAVFSADMRRQAAAGGMLIINPVNDMWFGDGRLADFHLALTTFRAVELGIPVLRVTNTGQTAAIEATGASVRDAELPRNTEAIATVQLTPAPAATLYARHGDIVLWVLTVLVLAGLLTTLWRNPCGTSPAWRGVRRVR